MNFPRLTRSGAPGVWLAVSGVLLSGCAPQAGGWNGIFAIDSAGAAKTCVASPVAPPDGKTVLVQVQMSNEGGWCGVTLNRAGVAYNSYLLVTRPAHGRVFAHHVGQTTRVDYTPDPGFVGTDSYAVRLIPGNAVLEGGVTVTKAQ